MTHNTPELDGWYVTGLCEGEGCFHVSFTLRKRLKVGIETRPSFSLSLNQRDLHLLQSVQKFSAVAESAIVEPTELTNTKFGPFAT
jgi:hypothetical protein